jgi:hypothetical protein
MSSLNLGLWSVPSEGGGERKVMALNTVRMGYWGVAGEGIVFVDVAREEGAHKLSLKLFRPNSGEVSPLGEFENRNLFFHGFSVTPDHRTVVWNQMEEPAPRL